METENRPGISTNKPWLYAMGIKAIFQVHFKMSYLMEI